MKLDRVSQGSSRWLLLAGFLLIAGTALHILAGQGASAMSSIHRIGNDDAYISFRYAENLASGHGLVFNPGERVEGYSNLLHVLLASLLLQVVDRDGLFFAVSFANLLVLVWAFVLFHQHVRNRHGEGPGVAAALLFALAPMLWASAASGLETTLMLSLQVALWVVVERLESAEQRAGFLTLAVVNSLAVLLRADGFTLPAMTAGYFLLSRRYRLAGMTVLTALPAVVGLFLWRLSYYGLIFPNTYYAKVSGSLGERAVHAVSQLFELALSHGFLVHLVALGVALASSLWRSGGRRIPFGSFLTFSVVLYWIYVGGDHFGVRFLLLLYPLGIVALLELFPGRGSRTLLGGLLAVALLMQARPVVEDSRFEYSLERYDGWITLGRYLGERFPGEELAVGAAGKIPFFSGLPTLDMRGLTDAHIGRVESTGFENPGHEKSDPEYVLARRPELIATWIGPDLDMALGLDRETYQNAGYRLRFLLNATRTSRRHNVVDVANLALPARQRLTREGYHYGVLQKVREAEPCPGSDLW